MPVEGKSVLKDIKALIEENPGGQFFEVKGMTQVWTEACLSVIGNAHFQIEQQLHGGIDPSQINYQWIEDDNKGTLALPTPINLDEMLDYLHHQSNGVLNNRHQRIFQMKEDRPDGKTFPVYITPFPNPDISDLALDFVTFLTSAHGYDQVCGNTVFSGAGTTFPAIAVQKDAWEHIITTEIGSRNPDTGHECTHGRA